jgi:hypothetical protein
MRQRVGTTTRCLLELTIFVRHHVFCTFGTQDDAPESWEIQWYSGFNTTSPLEIICPGLILPADTILIDK